MKMALCHPSRKHFAKSLCRNCYNKLTCQGCWSPENRLHRRWMSEYNLTPERYAELYDAGCWLCGEPFDATRGMRAPHVDHDHNCCPGPKSCGECVRGLAHKFCNHTIASENPDLLRRIADALERYLCSLDRTK